MRLGKKMRVRPAWGASGVQNFFGDWKDKYWYHKPLALIGMWLLWLTFVAKTSTLFGRPGNMPLEDDGVTPKELVPKCIVVKWRKRVVLNAVGLSGRGLKFLLDQNRWQKRREDFFISLMSVAPNIEERVEETRQSVRMLVDRLSEFKAHVGAQQNVSCPNVGAKYSNIVAEAHALLDVYDEVDPDQKITVAVKVAPTISPEEGVQIMRHPRCRALCVGNTLPFGELANEVDYVDLFGSTESPLKARGFAQAGGLSGKPLQKIVNRLVREIRRLGGTKHINVCGGILGWRSALMALLSGGDSIAIGVCPILSPWGVLPAIVTAYVVTWLRENFTRAK
jgi:dihydroorotate dehydrogenase